MQQLLICIEQGDRNGIVVCPLIVVIIIVVVVVVCALYDVTSYVNIRVFRDSFRTR
jgi:hypothetical protein